MSQILVVNAGSSSLKISLLVDEEVDPVAEDEFPAPGSDDDRRELAHALRGRFAGADAVGHRIVHGGERFVDAVRVDADVRRQLEELVALAPLHQPGSLAALDAVSDLLPDIPAYACFDTAFHRNMAPAARTYALPLEWRQRWSLCRYGFHGLSHAYIARTVPHRLGLPGDRLRIISCHLGSGASLCAIAGGRSADTTMGFTPLAGLVMATRSGDVDPGLVLWLQQQGVTAKELSDGLEHASGLQGLAGTPDMRAVLTARADGDPRAELAVSVYVHRLSAQIAAMAAAMGGADAIAFTGGIGEHAPEIRDLALRSLSFLGSATVLTIPAREDLEIARQIRQARLSDTG